MIWTKKTSKLLIAVAGIFLYSGAYAQSYTAKNLKVAMYSSTPVEDIRAVSNQATGVILANTHEILVQVPIKSLDFDRKLMQEHFNENYMESDKYPVARFKGTISPAVDLSKDGVYPVTVNGTLSVHGVDKTRSVPGKITVSNGEVQVSTEFKVACVDHNIQVPKLVFAKIAEQISIKVEGKFNPKK